jgi:hypothetical protein
MEPDWVSQFLRPDEEVLESFPAVEAAAVDDDDSLGPMGANSPADRLIRARRSGARTVVSTNQRILVLYGYGQVPSELVAEQPRSVQMAKRTPTVGNLLAALGHYQIEIGTQILLVSKQYGGTLPWAENPADARPPMDHAAHVQGRICKVCGKPIELGEAARRRGESQWAHDVCPVI